MHDRLRTFCDLIETALDQRSLKAIIQAFARESGFEYFAYVEVKGQEYTLLTNYQKQWLEIYAARNYRTIDPVATAAHRYMSVFGWSLDDMQQRGMSANLREFRNQAIKFGLRCGITIPVIGAFGSMAVLTFATSNPVANLVRNWDPQLAARAVHGIRYALKSLGGLKGAAAERPLSPKERACLTWQAAGKSIPETAGLVGISPRTAQHYLDSTREKLNAATIAQAVAIAKDRGII